MTRETGIDGWLDISVPLTQRLPVWPGSPGLTTSSLAAIERGDTANVTQVTMDVHTGTHVDAPRHFVAGARTIGEIGLHPFVGRAEVVSTGACRPITAAALEAANVPPDTERLLLRTANSNQVSMYEQGFDSKYAALTIDAAEWIAKRKFLLIGIDYLSIQSFTATDDVHRCILGADIAILEGISLVDVEPGSYDLICLPLRLVDAEAAPARAIVRPNSHSND